MFAHVTNPEWYMTCSARTLHRLKTELTKDKDQQDNLDKREVIKT